MKAEAASRTRRAFASLCTVAPCGLYGLLVLLIVGRDGMVNEPLVMLAYVPLVAWLLFDGADRRGSLGLRLMRCRIGSQQGGEIGFWRCFWRLWLGIMFVPLFPVSAMVALCNERGRTLADMASGTTVWYEPASLGQDARASHVMPLEDRQHL